MSASSKNVTSPSVADISRKRDCGSVSSGTCQATPRSRSAYQWNSSITTSSTLASFPLAQRDVGEDLGRAAEDGRVAVDRRVSRREADLLGPQLAAEGHPLLVDERLDRAGVDGAPPVRERGEVEGRGDQRLARAGRRVQDDVLALEQLEDRLLLRRVERQPLVGDVVEEAPEQRVAVRGSRPAAGGRRAGQSSRGYCGSRRAQTQRRKPWMSRPDPRRRARMTRTRKSPRAPTRLGEPWPWNPSPSLSRRRSRSWS